MTDLALVRAGITDDDIAVNQPLVRAELHTRLENLWAAVEPYVDGTADRHDPRMLELGLRVIKESTALWKLGQQVASAPEDTGLTPHAIALEKAKKDLLELEARQAS